MARKTQSKQIGENTFTVTQLPGTKGLLLNRRLLAMAAPVISKLGPSLKDFDTSKGLLNADLTGLVGSAGDAASTLFESLTEQELERLKNELLETTTVTTRSGKSCQVLDVFDELMAGQVKNIWLLLWFAVQVNFEDFGDALAGMFRGATARAMLSESKESTTSSGPVGG